MNISLICFSPSGSQVMEQLCDAFQGQGHTVFPATKSAGLPHSLTQPLKEWCKEQFAQADALLFIGAAGIAVRTIAPFVTDKKTDPAVIVIDELGKFAISLLSGHWGGANALARECAEILHCIPVITTATDLNGRFAVDTYAKTHQMALHHWQAAKAVSAALLRGEPVGFYSDYPIEGALPEGLLPCQSDKGTDKSPAAGIAITIRKACRPFAQTAVLVPKTIILGLGCKKGRSKEDIDQAVSEALALAGLYPDCLRLAASIDLKAAEPGILEFCRKRRLPFVTYSGEELAAVQGDFSPSAFVSQVTGVDNVCERSAIRAGGAGLLLKKQKANGVTVAFAYTKESVKF